MERFDFFMERFSVCHGVDVRLTVEFSESTVEFPDLTGLTRFTGLVLRKGTVSRPYFFNLVDRVE